MSAIAISERSALPRAATLRMFFDNLESFAETLGGVTKLRELILDLAVRGDLVEQDENNGPASELLETIQSHKRSFIEEREINRVRKLVYVNESEQPFPAPSKWIWCRLGDIARPQAGFSFKSNLFHASKEGWPPIRIRDIRHVETQVHYSGDYRDEFIVDTGDYLIGMDGNFNVAKWKGPRALLNQRVTRLQWYSDQVEKRYVTIALQHRLFELQGKKAYTTVDHLSGKQIEDSLIPLPPLAEQRRIVAKVDSLMALCDELEKQGTERVKVREHASNSCLGRLVKSNPGRDLAIAWQRLSDHFEVLYDTPETIGALRQSILQLAIQGKLVPQDRPAPELLLGGLLRENSLNGYSKRPSSQPAGVEILRISAGTARDDFLVDETEHKWADATKSEMEKFNLKAGDLLGCRFNGNLHFVGRFSMYTGMSGKRQIFPDKLIRFRVEKSRFDPAYVRYAMNAAQTRKKIEAFCATTAGNIGISASNLKTVSLPVPPLLEQKRIVAKVDQLLSQCDELSKQLQARQSTTQQLLTAIIRHLLDNTMTPAS